MGKIKMASQVGLSEKSFAMQLSVFWLFFPQKKPIEQMFYRLYTSLRGQMLPFNGIKLISKSDDIPHIDR